MAHETDISINNNILTKIHSRLAGSNPLLTDQQINLFLFQRAQFSISTLKTKKKTTERDIDGT